MELTFGDGTDTDTLETVFGRLDGYTVGVTLADGTVGDFRFDGVAHDEPMMSVALTPIVRVSDPAGGITSYDEATGDALVVEIDQVRALVVY